jgi:hypothetical protein
MQVTFGQHWYTFSTEVRAVDDVLDSIAGVSGGDFGPVEHRGMFNQPMRFLHTTGTEVYFGSKREEQPIVVNVPGAACELVPSEELALWAENVQGRVSRVDLAADLEPASHARRRLLEMRKIFRKGDCETRIPKTSTHFLESDKPGDGCTLYVGSTKSDLLLRAYDRRGPLRIEWQWKPSDRRVRETVAATLRHYGVAALWRALGQSCVWPMRWYQDVLKGKCADIANAATKPNDLARTMAAIMEQLGPTLAALQLAGVGLGELACMPTKPNAEQLRKWEAWVAQAPELGYDPKGLEAEVSRWRRSRSNRRS